MSGVETVFMVIICGFISVNLLEMKDNKYYMSPESSEEDLPLVTIITPTYNSNPQYLKEAIESVLEQTYPKIEYIITDDGSSVFHEELIHELLETKNRGNVTWKVIRHDENLGTVKNLNYALQISSGDFIFYLAHDDVYYNNSVISDRVNHFLLTGCLVSMCLAEYVSLDLQRIIGVFPCENEVLKMKMISPSVLASRLVFINPYLGAAFAFSKIYFEKYGLYDERYKLMEDAQLVHKCLTNNVPIEIHEIIGIKYRTNPSDKSNQYSRNPIYNADRITLRREQFKSAIGVWKLLMWMDLNRLIIKQAILLKDNKVLLMLIIKMEHLVKWIIN